MPPSRRPEVLLLARHAYVATQREIRLYCIELIHNTLGMTRAVCCLPVASAAVCKRATLPFEKLSTLPTPYTTAVPTTPTRPAREPNVQIANLWRYVLWRSQDISYDSVISYIFTHHTPHPLTLE